MTKRKGNAFFDLLRASTRRYDPDEVVRLFGVVGKERVLSLASDLSKYIDKNLPRAIDSREGLADYRTNPYVLLTCATVMGLEDPTRFADFLFNSKLYMGLETSFGKSVERAIVSAYPIGTPTRSRWCDPPEKLTESESLKGLSREEKAKARTASIWREVDKSCVVGAKRFVASIKSGTSTINDSQVQAMTTAIVQNHKAWMQQTKRTCPGVNALDVVIGLTYGTDRTTNNKENQILVKLLDHGFKEEARDRQPGVLVDTATRSIRVYRRVGRDFWAFIGNPVKPETTQFVFLEVLLALSKALSTGLEAADLETRINQRVQALASALSKLTFPRKSLPNWVRDDFSETELFWFATAISAFYDEGI